MARLRIQLKVFDEPLVVDESVPDHPIRLDEALPFLQQIDEGVVARAIGQVEAKGEKVSCARGCSACCRSQPVPVTPPEALAISRLVTSLPEEQRRQVEGRFAERVQRLEQAELAPAYLERSADLTREEARQIAERYMALKIVCPFLVEDACSIYLHRPFVCRQYLVTSPAELCLDPLTNPIQRVPMPIRAASATLVTASALFAKPQYTIPLVLALEYIRKHPELERRFESEVVFRHLLRSLGN
jgi:Fe-S-cluster containining protein